MGNHNVGRTMAKCAEIFWKINGDKPVTKIQALELLELSANEFHGADAEFDDEFFGETPLSKLVAIAFDATPEEIFERDTPNEEVCLWYDGPETRFRKHFNFC